MSTDADTAPSQDREWAAFEYQPSTFSTGVALGASLVAVAALASVMLSLSIGAALGTIVLVGGLARGSRRLVVVGAGVMFGALVAGGLAGGPVVLIVVAGAATLVAFDTGRYAVVMGRQIGADGKSIGAERRHVGATVSASGVAAIVGSGTFLVGPGEQPGVILFALVLAAVLFVSGLTVMGGSEDDDRTS